MAPANSNFSTKFLRAHPVTAGWEGTWSNHPADRGGKTMYGVTEAVFWQWLDSRAQARRPVRSITEAEALSIYFSNYWRKAGCEALFPGVDLATYDAAVNSGVSRGRKWLLASLDKQNRHDRTVKGICAKRLSFVHGLANWKTFGNGWGNRIADIQAKGVAWALQAIHDSPIVSQQLADEADLKTKKANNQAVAGATSATAGTGTVVVDQGGNVIDQAATAARASVPTAQLSDWLVSGIGVALIVVAVVIAWHMVRNRQQAKAYERQAEELRHA